MAEHWPLEHKLCTPGQGEWGRIRARASKILTGTLRASRPDVDVNSRGRRRAAVRVLTRRFRDCSSVTGADLRIARQEQGESTRDPLNDSELAPNSANGSIPSLIAWTVPKPPGNAATVSQFPLIVRSVDRSFRKQIRTERVRNRSCSGPRRTPPIHPKPAATGVLPCTLEVLESRQLLAPLASTPNLGGMARSALPADDVPDPTRPLEPSHCLGPGVHHGQGQRSRSEVHWPCRLGRRDRQRRIPYQSGSQTAISLFVRHRGPRGPWHIRLKWNDPRSNLWYMGVNLGLPSSDEINDGFGGRISHFQFGDIDWTRPTGRTRSTAPSW